MEKNYFEKTYNRNVNIILKKLKKDKKLPKIDNLGFSPKDQAEIIYLGDIQMIARSLGIFNENDAAREWKKLLSQLLKK